MRGQVTCQPTQNPGLLTTDKSAKRLAVIRILIMAMAMAIVMTMPGCASRSRQARRAKTLPLLPLALEYPPETDGWDTSQVLLVNWAAVNQTGLSNDIAARQMAAELRQRGYKVILAPIGKAGMMTRETRGQINRVLIGVGSTSQRGQLSNGTQVVEITLQITVTPVNTGANGQVRLFTATVQKPYAQPGAIPAEIEKQLLFEAMSKIFRLSEFRQALQ